MQSSGSRKALPTLSIAACPTLMGLPSRLVVFILMIILPNDCPYIPSISVQYRKYRMLLNPKSRMGNQVIGVGNAVSPDHVMSPSMRMGSRIAPIIRMSISHATNLSPQKASVSCVFGCFWTGVPHFGQYVALSESLFPHFWQ